MSLRRATGVLLALAAGLAAGCGAEESGGFPLITSQGSGGGSGPGPAPGPVDTSAFLVPRAAAAVGAVESATQAVTHVLMDPYTGGAASNGPALFQFHDTTIEFTYTIEFNLDLDSEGRDGADRFPNASGMINVVAVKTVSGTIGMGEAAHDVTITATSDVTFTDPDSGDTAMIPEGSTWTCAVDVAWTFTDRDNWTVTATATKTVDLQNLVVTEGDQTFTVDVTGTREVVTTLTRVEGELTRERTVSGMFTIDIDDGTEVQTVTIEFGNDGATVTVGDETFGPLSAEELRELFGALFM